MEIINKFIVDVIRTGVTISYFMQGVHYNFDTKFLAGYLDNQLHGYQRKWHLNGQLHYCIRFSHDKHDGTYCSWYPDGKLQYSAVYDNSKLIRRKIHYQKKN